ncbi:DsbA family protein [Aestuariirhabdus litorea]|uniref:Disulfide bond formation protein DsbA n=1 Tax=Aestuariirhabdus litorea TaxID=2528527 RepID=A0A3P3VKW6_9GAMM|nr:thioredoxin domain-containing protein [Aestuariirhabdus litorea]RRJ82366.1 disulfide bond formation protein DsbA [Aestuariirhabdus litorea]RWW92529.1 disulfide bond formation protein DsbA [Endozoicomonadaceae bacterium GTF-13]
MKKQKRVVLVAALVLPVLVVVGLWFAMTPPAETPELSAARAEALVRPHSPVLGSSRAQVTLVEFLDPACETCKLFYPEVKKLLAGHAGKVELVVRYAPFHRGSDTMVKMLVAAQRQGKFWPVLEVMLETQQQWAINHQAHPELMWPHLGGLGLDIEQLKQDMKDPAIDAIIQQDLADAATLGVKKTPDFFVNGQPLPRFGYQELRDLLLDEVNRVY